MSNSTRWYLGAVAAIVAIAIAVVLTGTAPTAYPVGSPEATVQAYLEAVIDDDFAAAQALVTESGKEECDGFIGSDNGLQRARISDANTSGDIALVEVTLSWSGGADAFASEYSENSRFELTMTETGWMVDRLPWSLCWGR